LAHAPTWLAVSAEREVSRAMGGSCSMPLAAFATWQGSALHLRAAYGDPDGVKPLARALGHAAVADAAQARALGAQVAAQLKTAMV
jgi:hydroxymethylbilane synthase